ncbi:AAA family ATPase [Curtobacterium sp. Leaf261]|uniref:AAA family ATPase n=1 Tax=Curtobacterium sp. Leaf261 TaxID=1736311 RepID=UPI0006FD3F58|nr:AAA family ATPase [Curtobacterium sp. Leaf261]KQO65164.1 hypothetical protein ASF23_03355 [Curtobacterium sp. Leaf261]
MSDIGAGPAGSDGRHDTGVEVVLLNGTVGSGKSTVADALATLAQERGVAHAVIDLDHIRRGWPSPEGDRFNSAMLLANLRDMVRNFRTAGASRFILAGVLEDPAEVRSFRSALGLGADPASDHASTGLLIVRLVADDATLRHRLHRRHEGQPAELGWHLHRVGELADILASAGVDDTVLEVGSASPEDLALQVWALAGW